MKTRTKIVIAAAVIVGITGLALIPHTMANGAKKYLGARFAEMGHHGPDLFERFDTDKDGSVTQSEIDKARTDLMARFDANQDGKLSLKEYEGLWLEMIRERMVDRFQRLDRDGDAVVTTDEFTKPTGNIVGWVDSDGDGKVTQQELKQMGPRGGHHGGPERRRHRN